MVINEVTSNKAVGIDGQCDLPSECFQFCITRSAKADPGVFLGISQCMTLGLTLSPVNL